MKLEEKYLSSYFLINFDFLKKDEIINNYLKFLKELTISSSLEAVLKPYCDFIKGLEGKNLADYIKKLILKNKNKIKTNDYKELNIINELFSLNFEYFLNILGEKFVDKKEFLLNLPRFETKSKIIEKEDLKGSYPVEDIFLDNQAFIFNSDFEITPVKVAQNISFKDLKGYKEQQKVLLDNTKALLLGQRVNNILLYGDAGCGKSSSVRALLQEFPELKIVQIFKDNLINLDKLYQLLINIPSKFIIFADDISFSDTDGAFSTMKAILEGSLITCPNNAVIYATSNRRHLVKETFQSRIGDEIHLNDTINEMSSLSERFGINLLFQRPSNDEFISILNQLADDYSISIDREVLIQKAQKMALIKGSRSPRIARQVIDNIIAGVEL